MIIQIVTSNLGEDFRMTKHARHKLSFPGFQKPDNRPKSFKSRQSSAPPTTIPTNWYNIRARLTTQRQAQIRWDEIAAGFVKVSNLAEGLRNSITWSNLAGWEKRVPRIAGMPLFLGLPCPGRFLVKILTVSAIIRGTTPMRFLLTLGTTLPMCELIA